MSRTFAYCRVSTTEQTAENQLHAIRSSGFDVEDHRAIYETISGGVPAMQRPSFKTLVEDKLETGDSLVVLKLDRLGRDNIDVQHTISKLLDRGVSVVSLDLPARDLASSEGKLILQMFSAFAEFERNRIAERTREGLERAVKEGKKLGRPEAVETTKNVLAAKARGLSQSATATFLGISLPTVKRHWNK